MSPESLFNETRLLFHVLKRWAEVLHPGLEISVPMRAVLEHLLLEGRTTVPAMARARGVSRQHVQQQVDALLRLGLVDRSSNPAHQRSPLVMLTDRGRARIQNLRSEELAVIAELQPGVSDQATADAARVLSAWRAALERDLAGRTP